MSITYEEAVADRKKVKQQYTRKAKTLTSYMFAQLSKKDVIALHAEMQVIAEEVLDANAIVCEVGTEDALVRAERWNADFEADHKAIFDRVFKYIAPPVPNNSSPQLSTGSFTEEDYQESNHVSEIPQSPTRAVRTSDDRRPDSPITDSACDGTTSRWELPKSKSPRERKAAFQRNKTVNVDTKIAQNADTTFRW